MNIIRISHYFFYSIVIKVKFGNRLSMNGVQAFGKHSKLKIQNDGVVSIDKVSTYENFQLSCIGGKVEIGKGVFFNRNCLIVCRENVVIEDNCIFGPNVVIYDHNHLILDGKVDKNRYNSEAVVIGEGCWIGADVIILKGTHIGKRTIIGAGTIVSGNIPSDTIVTQNRELCFTPIKK